MVMIAAHRVAKQSWPFRRKVTTVKKAFRRRLSPQFMILSMCDAPGDLRRFVNVPSSTSCIEDEWWFKGLGQKRCQSCFLDSVRKWVWRIESVWWVKLFGESESSAADVLWVSVASGSGHVLPGKLNSAPLPPDSKCLMRDIRRKWIVCRTASPRWNEWWRVSVGGLSAWLAERKPRGRFGTDPTDTALESSRAPINKLDSALCLDGGYNCIHVLGHHITSVHRAACHVLAIAWVTFGHHWRGLKDTVGDLRHIELLMICLLSRNDGGIWRKHKVNPWVRNHVGLEFSHIHI